MPSKIADSELRGNVIRCDIYAGGNRIRSFPEDRSLSVIKAATRNGNVLVLECLDARGKLVQVETTLPYMLIVEAPLTCSQEARKEMEVPVPLSYAEIGTA